MPETLYTSNFKKICLFVTLLFTILLLVGNWFEEIHISEVDGKSISKLRWEEFYNIKNDTIELLFLGSSHSYQGFDPYIFEEILGVEAFNFGSPSQQPDTSYYVLKEVLNYQKPNLVIIDVYWKMFEKDHYIDQVRFNYEFMKKSDNKTEFYDNVFTNKDKLSEYLKIIKYKETFNMYINRMGREIKGNVANYKGKGFVYSENIIGFDELIKNNDFENEDIKKSNFSEIQLEYFKKIIEHCKSEDIDVVLVTAPIPQISFEYIQNYEEANNLITKIAVEYGVPYIDYNLLNMETKIFEISNFSDDNHLNYSGSKILSEKLAKELNDR